MRSSAFYALVTVEATWGAVTRCLSLQARVVSAEGSWEAFTSSWASSTGEAPLPPGCQWRPSGEHGLPPPGGSKVAPHFLCQSSVRGSQLLWTESCPRHSYVKPLSPFGPGLLSCTSVPRCGGWGAPHLSSGSRVMTALAYSSSPVVSLR